MPGCRRLSGRGRGFFIIYCGDGLHFIGTSFQRDLFD
ncbi:hypothetical protein T01_4899 [Trichinella spiralis]|uniref:Uncharacterized protein n=1 Tax=Trichinella spiralis TaxID=6334 RepID=A0A0V0YC48_TRISP|nr:hypothetical protein T01_4899 [Trichinella spiralis]